MASDNFPTAGPFNAPIPPLFIVSTPTTTPAQIDSAGKKCVGVLAHVPDFNDAAAAVDANVYISNASAGAYGIEMAPGEKRFIGCSNTNQLWVKRVAGAGGAVAFVRFEVVRGNGQS